MKQLSTLILFGLFLVFSNCKDKTEDPVTTPPITTKTLDKTQLTDKHWKTDQGTAISHYFRSDGNFCTPNGDIIVGTWQWLNNSDSLEIVKPSTTGRSVWYVEYCTATEMKMKLDKSQYKIYTKQ